MSGQPNQSNAPEQTEGLHITHDKNGRKLPNVRRAGGEFTAEDVRFIKKETPELYAHLQQQAERVLDGKEPDVEPGKLIDRIDRAAVLAELAPEGIKFSAQGRPDLRHMLKSRLLLRALLESMSKMQKKLVKQLVLVRKSGWN